MTVPPAYLPPPDPPHQDPPYQDPQYQNPLYQNPQWNPPPNPWPPPYPYQYPAPPPPPKHTNGLAVAAIICAVLFAPLGVLFGHLSLSQIKKTGEEGRGLAVAGLIVGYSLTVVTVVSVVAAAMFFSWVGDEIDKLNQYPDGPSATAKPAPAALPAFDPPADLGRACAYPASDSPASKPATPPRSGVVPTDPATVTASMTTNDGTIGLDLDNAKAPCTVNSFISLAQQGFFDDTTCHRLTANNSLSVLQCGDPTGTGEGGPGYDFANEYPTNQFPPDDPALSKTLLYPRGTLAMANAGVDTNGSQFFIVYEDSRLPPTYTVFGSIDETGLATVDEIAAAGVTGGNLDGKPAQPVRIESIRLN